MSEVETQLREYFDAAVERITPEDILASWQVTERVRPTRQRWTLRPGWAAVAAFFGTIFLLGGPLALGIGLGEPGLDVVSGAIPEAVSEAAGTVSWWWLVIPVVAVGVSVIVALVVRKQQQREKKMQKLEQPSASVEQREHTSRYLIIGLVVALVLAAGLAAWLIVDNRQTVTERDINALLDDYAAAWEANDGAAVLALMTPDASIKAGDGVTYGHGVLKALVDNLGYFAAERIGDPMIIERSPTAAFSTPEWMVAQHSMVELLLSTNELDLFRIVEEDGRLLVAYHETWRGGQ